MQGFRSVAFFGVYAGICLCGSSVLAGEPSKPIRECAREYVAREQRLKLAGVSAASFFHECWWHSRPGEPTDIASLVRPADNAATTMETKSTLRGETHKRPQLARAHRNGGGLRAALYAAAIKGRPWHRREAYLPYWMRRSKKARVMLARRRQDLLSIRHEIETADRRQARGLKLAERRVRYAIKREGFAPIDKPITSERSALIPPNAIDGRRAWIGAKTEAGSMKIHAVIVGPLETRAIKGSFLHCWDQNVLFLRRQAHWASSLVCDGKTEPGIQEIWFEEYE